MASNTVSQSNFILDIWDYYNLYDGRAILENYDRYLQQKHFEGNDQYIRRAEWSTFSNWCKKVHDIYMGYIFSNGVIVEDANSNFNSVQFTKEMVYHALIGGICYILILPESPGVYRADRVVFDKEDNKVKIYGEKKFGKAEYDDDGCMYEIDFESHTLTDHSTGEVYNDFQDDQLVKFSWNFGETSLFNDIGPINVKIYNKESTEDTFHDIMTLLFIQGENKEKPNNQSYTQRLTGDTGIKIIQPSNFSILPVLTENIKRLQMEIGSITGLSTEFQDKVIQSGLSKSFDMVDTNSIILNICARASLIHNQVAETYANLIESSDIATITIQPILKPSENNDKLTEIKDVMNQNKSIPDIVIFCKQQSFNTVFPALKPDENEKYMTLINKEGGEVEREELNFEL